MFKAFLSHSSAQKEYVRTVAGHLGIDNCFIDESSFENGMKTMDEIVKSIGNSSVFVFFISSEALESDWVKNELSNVRDYIDNGEILFMPFIVDENIIYSDPRIKPWIRKDYNLQFYSNPVLVARRIKEEIREMSWRTFPEIQKTAILFQGREDEMAQIKKMYYDGNMSCRRCFIVSGFPPGIGRRKIITEYIKSELAPCKTRTYEPITIDLDANSSIEDFIFRLNDIVLAYSHEMVLGVSSKSKEYKVGVAVELISRIDKSKEYVVIRDNGVCVLSNGQLSDWFIDILRHKDLPHKICLLLTSSYHINNRTETTFPSIIALKINPLKRESVKVLFYAYASLKQITTNEDTEKLIRHIQGIPSLIFRCADLMKIYSKPGQLLRQIVDMQKNEEKCYAPIINDLKKEDDCFQILVLMSMFEFISHDIVEQILTQVGKKDELYQILDKLYSFALFERIGSNSQYYRVNTIVADYINRNRMTLSK